MAVALQDKVEKRDSGLEMLCRNAMLRQGAGFTGQPAFAELHVVQSEPSRK